MKTAQRQKKMDRKWIALVSCIMFALVWILVANDMTSTTTSTTSSSIESNGAKNKITPAPPRFFSHHGEERVSQTHQASISTGAPLPPQQQQQQLTKATDGNKNQKDAPTIFYDVIEVPRVLASAADGIVSTENDDNVSSLQQLQCPPVPATLASGGRYWSQRKKSCESIPGWAAPLLSFEVSSEELSCLPPPDATSDWVNFPFEKLKSEEVYRTLIAEWRFGRASFLAAPSLVNASSSWSKKEHAAVVEEEVVNKRATTEESKRRSHPSPLPDEVTSERYSAFYFHSSWIFRQWKRWQPHPIKTNPDVAFDDFLAKNEYRLRASHDSQAEDIYRVGHFCISPHQGMTGFMPEVAPYRGKDDTRGLRDTHVDVYLRNYLAPPSSSSSSDVASTAGIRARSEPAPYYDARPVMFMPLAHTARWNLAHTLSRFLSMIGILKKPNLFYRPIKADSTPLEFFPDPLLVFVNEPKKGDLLSRTTAALGLYFRVLDLPWAVVSSRGVGEDALAEQEQYVLEMSAKVRHKVDVRTVGQQQSEVCFQHGVVYQNCLSCSGKDPESENTVSYSFGNWATKTPAKERILADYRRLMDSCLGGVQQHHFTSSDDVLRRMVLVDGSNAAATSVSTTIDVASSTKSKTTSRLPRIFFDVRTGVQRTPGATLRGIRHFGSMIEEIQDAAKSFSSRILFREPWRGSRSTYVNELRTSDIFIGVHGASFSQVSLMPKRSVVVELTVPYFFLEGDSEKTMSNATSTEQNSDDRGRKHHRPGAWFDIYTGLLDHDHWFFKISESLQEEYDVSAVVIIEMLREAACRWTATHHQPSSSVLASLREQKLCKYETHSHVFLQAGMTE